jgi:formimidoylglutamate deiminase
MQILAPELLYHEGAFRSGLAVEYDELRGTITRVLARPDAAGSVTELRGRALLPGFINCHSHSFQRLIRGRTQWKPRGPASSDFWSWRESMYSAVLGISPDALYDVSRFCFMEMLRAGYTTVGEFHYVQRDPSGGEYSDPNELARRVIAAAESVGIRICLLNVCYATGGVGEPLRPEQRRFATPSLDQYLANTSSLSALFSGSTLVTVGYAPHSLRAVPRAWLRDIREHATTSGAPMHMHVAEQPAEVEACVQAYGLRPGQLLADDHILDGSFTAIHGTHLDAGEVAVFGASRASVCLCPSTERDLGDGLALIAKMLEARVSLCIGTDSQSIIDPLEELRLIEYNERLRLLRRVVVGSTTDDERYDTPPQLLSIGTTGGARSLGVNAGAFEAGMSADFVGIDLEHDALAGWNTDSLAALIMLSAPASVVCDVWVNGMQRIIARRHAAEEEITRAYRATASAGVS